MKPPPKFLTRHPMPAVLDNVPACMRTVLLPFPLNLLAGLVPKFFGIRPLHWAHWIVPVFVYAWILQLLAWGYVGCRYLELRVQTVLWNRIVLPILWAAWMERQNRKLYGTPTPGAAIEAAAARAALPAGPARPIALPAAGPAAYPQAQPVAVAAPPPQVVHVVHHHAPTPPPEMDPAVSPVSNQGCPVLVNDEVQFVPWDKAGLPVLDEAL